MNYKRKDYLKKIKECITSKEVLILNKNEEDTENFIFWLKFFLLRKAHFYCLNENYYNLNDLDFTFLYVMKVKMNKKIKLFYFFIGENNDNYYIVIRNKRTIEDNIKEKLSKIVKDKLKTFVITNETCTQIIPLKKKKVSDF